MSCILKIGNRKIGDNFKPFIICELGINHHGSLKIAKKMVGEKEKFKIDFITQKPKPYIGQRNDTRSKKD